MPDPTTGARAVPIYQSTSFVFEDTADAADLFALQKYGTIYSRISNPTTAALEERVASLEGGIGSVATASGQAAEFLAVTTLAGAGDHLVAASGLYGGTHTLFGTTLARLGLETSFVDNTSVDEFAAAINDRTTLVYTEIIGNPSGAVPDLEAARSKYAKLLGVEPSAIETVADQLVRVCFFRGGESKIELISTLPAILHHHHGTDPCLCVGHTEVDQPLRRTNFATAWCFS